MPTTASSTPDPKPFRVLLPVTHLEDVEPLLFVGAALARPHQGEFILLLITVVPAEQSLADGTADVIQQRTELEALLRPHSTIPNRVRSEVVVSRHLWDGIWEAVAEEEADLLLFSWDHYTLPEIDEIVDRRLAEPPVDVVLVRPREELRHSRHWREHQRLLLPLRPSPDAEFALNVASTIATAAGAEISFLQVQENEQDSDLLSDLLAGEKESPAITRSVIATGDAAERILAETEDHDVVVLGAPTRELQNERWSGTVLDAVAESTDSTLFVVKAAKPRKKRTSFARSVSRPLAEKVDKWFAQNTFHSSEFDQIERLVELKRDQGVTISLGLPALNEEATVGSVISSTKSALMDVFPLLDEVVLIDSDSSDRTREIAQDLGVPVYIHQEILPEHGAHRGKGEALWKSLHVLQGDIVVWIDTDIKNIHPRFVYGVLGPLLRNERVLYSKGFYKRPLKQGASMIAGGGGRVTELAARPLLNLFFPELSGLVQPLSGEYGGRREALERVPFFTGYGVETGLLIDLLNTGGLESIAQVDLLERIHHNQPLRGLSKMAFAIIQVVVSRLEKRHGQNLLAEDDKTMNLIRQELEGYSLDPVEIREIERPPMIEIPEYRAKRETLVRELAL